MKYCVLGAGLMGKAAAYDLLHQHDTTSLMLVDSNKSKLVDATDFLSDNRLITIQCNVEDLSTIESILKDSNAAIAAIHYKFNEAFTKAAIKAKTHLCDLGGNDSVVDAQLKLDLQAKEAGITIIPDCGLAPGLVAVLVKWGLEEFSWADTVKIRVGGLPQNPLNSLKYERLFSVDGLINEYIEPVRILQDGEIKTIEPLTDIETIEFPLPFGKLEAFTTSGGASTLIDTYKNRLRNLDYKTIRYPGHASIMRSFYELGFFSNEAITNATNKTSYKPRDVAAFLLEKNIPLCTNDAVLVKIIFQGGSKKHELTIIDKSTDYPLLTAMMRTTAFPASIIASMLARGDIKKTGVLPQEECIPTELFIAELEKRNIRISGLTQNRLRGVDFTRSS